MANKVVVKNSVVAGRRPATAATNKPGELWVNAADYVIGSFDATGAPIELGSITLSATQVGFGSATNDVTSSSLFIFDEINSQLGVGVSALPATAAIKVAAPSFGATTRGTIGAPAFVDAQSPNTGIYFPAANRIGFVTNGFEVASFDASVSGQNRGGLHVRNNITITIAGQNMMVGRGANPLLVSNTAFGTDALKAVTTGDQNTAIGSLALAATTTGAGNLAIGSSALGANADGRNNVAIGQGAMQFNVGGALNLAIGIAALQRNVAGITNVAIGTDALKWSTSSSNLAIGYGAMVGSQTAPLDTGVDNVAIGYNAGLSLQGAASSNIFIGKSAGNGIIAGSSNTAIGSFYFNTNTSNTVAIGAGATEKFGANAAGQFTIVVPGSAALPALINADRTGHSVPGVGTGFWWPGVNSVAVSTGGVERMRWKDGATNLVPLTTAAIKALATPAKGDIAFSSDANALCFYDGAAWQKCTATPL